MNNVDDPVRIAFGQRLGAARELKGLTQVAVAAMFDVSKQTVSHWETGRADPGVYKLRALAKLYGVSADSLLWDSAPSIEAMQLAAQFDGLTPQQQSTLRALWMAYIDNAASDETVEQRMPITQTDKEKR